MWAELERDRLRGPERKPGGSDLVGDTAIQRDDGRDLEPVTLGERGRQSGQHIGEPARLGERRELASDVDNPQRQVTSPYRLNRGPADS